MSRMRRHPRAVASNHMHAGRTSTTTSKRSERSERGDAPIVAASSHARVGARSPSIVILRERSNRNREALPLRSNLGLNCQIASPKFQPRFLALKGSE
jgi:hypothetical protein